MSSDIELELSDLSEFDDNHAGADNLDSIRKSTESDYSLTQVLVPPRATTYTALNLYQQIYDSEIDLCPEYHRGVVWAKEKQICLINSVYHNHFIPPILFAVSIGDDGSKHRTCIDGKQLLTSIQLFMDGLIPYRDMISGQEYWYNITNSPGDTKTKELLPERLREMFANKQVVIVEYTGLTDANERDIFERLQPDVAMKPPEILGAISTPHSRFIRNLLDRYVTDSTLGTIPWALFQGGDFQCCFSHAVFCIGKWTSSPGDVRDHGALPDMLKWLEGPDEVSTDLKAQVEEVYDVFVELATSTNYSASFRKYNKVFPAEMVFIPVLIFAHGVLPSEELRYSRRELSTAISNMRHAVRENFQDVLMNHRVRAFLVDFIKKMGKKAGHALPAKVKRKRLYMEEEEDKQPPYTDTSSLSNSIPQQPTYSLMSTHTYNASDDDDEFDPLPNVPISADIDDAEGVSLGSEGSEDAVDVNMVRPDNTAVAEDLDAAVATDAAAPSPGLRTNSARDSPVITRREDLRGAIHFTANSPLSLSPKPPMYHLYSSLNSMAPSTPHHTRKDLVATNRTLATTPATELPRGPDGRYSASQKGKGKLKRKLTAETLVSSLPSPTSQPVEGSSVRPKEKAVERNAPNDANANFFDVQHRLQIVERDLQDSRASIRLLEAKLTATSTGPPQPTPPIFPPRLHTSTSSSPRTSTAVTHRSLIDRGSDSPQSHAGSSSVDIYSEAHERRRMSLHPEISQPDVILDPGMSQSAILTAPARWQFPSTTVPIVRIISRWRELFAKLDNSRLLPMPISAQIVPQHRSSLEDDPTHIILAFDSGGLNLFMDLWNSYHAQLPELYDITVMRCSQE